jgi:hypothetical protein
MANETKTLMHCSRFEEVLTDYLDRTLDAPTYKAAAEHAMACPLCHSLLNDVKGALAACRDMAEPKLPVTRLEAKILARTTPEAAIHCAQFEESLTDYLDGFLPAQVYHRWERHAVLCDECTDLPGDVVRALGAVVAYKTDELPVPFGLNERILQHTIGGERSRSAKSSYWQDVMAWIQSIRLPISVPQLAPVAMLALFAFMVFSQTVSADGSLTDVYQKGVLLAEETYKQGADAIGQGAQTQQQGDPITGATYVEDKK